MYTKVEPIFLYEGLGFPIELENVEMIKSNDEWHPKIDVHYVADEIIKKLAIQEERLTGNQVKFIRSYFPCLYVNLVKPWFMNRIQLSANGKNVRMR